MYRRKISVIVLSYLFGSVAFAQDYEKLADTLVTQNRKDVSEEIVVSFSAKRDLYKYATSPSSVFTADMDLDGHQDIVFNSFDFPSELIKSFGNGLFSSPVEITENASQDRRIVPADLNGDSLVDILSC